MSVTFSDALVERYQEYMHRRYGESVTLERAQQDLERLADLHALLSPTKVGGFSASARTSSEGRTQKGRPEGGLT